MERDRQLPTLLLQALNLPGRSPRHCHLLCHWPVRTPKVYYLLPFWSSKEGRPVRDNLRNRNRKRAWPLHSSMWMLRKKNRTGKNRTKFTCKELSQSSWSISLPWTSGSEGGSAKTSVSSGFITLILIFSGGGGPQLQLSLSGCENWSIWSHQLFHWSVWRLRRWSY